MREAALAWEGTNVRSLSPEGQRLHLRMLEALLFAAAEPLSESEIATRMPEGVDLPTLLRELQSAYAGRGVNLRHTEGRWAFRTAEDVGFVLKREVVRERKLSRAALETLAVIAYHQPVTRAEIEEIRGVAVSRGTHNVLLEAGWVRLRGRRRLDHFGLEAIGDLPGLADLKAAGLIETLANAGDAPLQPSDAPGLTDDEEPLELDFAGLDEGDPAAEEDAAAGEEDGRDN
jgi:segregation and condensation protein B